MNRLIIIGASGHGKVVADIAKLKGYENIVFIDDDVSVKECAGYPVIGVSSDAWKLNTSQVSDFFVAIGNSKNREKLCSKLKKTALNIVTLIHPDAVIASGVTIGTGSVVMAGTVINPGTIIGSGCIINTCSSVDHDCNIGDFSHIAVGTHLCGTVHVGNHCWIGAGVTVSNNIDICDDVILGAGAVVVQNIDDSGTYVGIPAKRIKKNNKQL